MKRYLIAMTLIAMSSSLWGQDNQGAFHIGGSLGLANAQFTGGGKVIMLDMDNDSLHSFNYDVFDRDQSGQFTSNAYWDSRAVIQIGVEDNGEFLQVGSGVYRNLNGTGLVLSGGLQYSTQDLRDDSSINTSGVYAQLQLVNSRGSITLNCAVSLHSQLRLEYETIDNAVVVDLNKCDAGLDAHLKNFMLGDREGVPMSVYAFGDLEYRRRSSGQLDGERSELSEIESLSSTKLNVGISVGFGHASRH